MRARCQRHGHGWAGAMRRQPVSCPQRNPLSFGSRGRSRNRSSLPYGSGNERRLQSLFCWVQARFRVPPRRSSVPNMPARHHVPTRSRAQPRRRVHIFVLTTA